MELNMDTKQLPSGELTVQILAMPKDTNANGDIFGGWLVSNMDMGGGIEARRHSGSRVVTVAIDAMRFIKPVNIGDLVSCYAELLKVGRTSMHYKMEVWTLSINQNEQKKVAEGTFVYVAIDDLGNKQAVYR
jgi:acyl-CoA thioesterase YciA